MYTLDGIAHNLTKSLIRNSNEFNSLYFGPLTVIKLEIMQQVSTGQPLQKNSSFGFFMK